MDPRHLNIDDFATTLLMQSDLDGIVWAIADRIGGILGLEDCVIYLRDGDVLYQAAVHGREKRAGERDIVNRIEIPVGSGIVGSVAKSGKPEIVPDTRSDPRYIWDQFSGRSELAVPIIFEDRVIGVLDSESADLDGYSQADLERMQTLANLAAPRIASQLRKRELAAAEAELRRREAALHYRIAFQDLVSDISSRFINLLAHEVDAGIETALERIATFVNASSAGVFRFHDGHRRFSLTHRWQAGESLRRMDGITGLEVDEYAWWMSRLVQGEPVSVANIAELPPEARAEREILEAVGVRSIIDVPIVNQGIVTGYLGLSVEDGPREWSDDDIALLELVGQIFSNALERKAADEALVRSRAAAEEANRAKSRFLANMSHELRTPLNAILGYSELLRLEAGSRADPAFIEELDNLHRAGNHLLSLITDVLDLAKIESGRSEIAVSAFDLPALLADVETTARPLAREKGNRLSISCDPALRRMESDPTRLRQVLLNLLGNAAKFTRNGQIRLEARHILAGGSQCARFAISDTGTGIPPDKLEEIFSEFVQADSSTTREYGGTGLGLPISRKLCELMGGEITVESQPGQGSTFYVTLPLVAGSAKQQADPAPDRRYA